MPSVGFLAAFGLVTFLAFPHPVGGGVLDLGFALAWLSPALLMLGIEGLDPRRALARGFLAGWLAHAAILHWIWVVTVIYGRAHPLVGALGPLGLGAYVGLFTAAFAAIHAICARAASRDARHAWLASPWVAAATWTALDHLRGVLMGGFPWATLAYAQHQNDALLAWAPYTGMYGLSFLTVLGGAALARSVRLRRVDRSAALALAGVVLAWLAGFGLRAVEAPDPDRSIRVAVVQGNIEQGVKWNRDWYEKTFAIYEDLTRRAAGQGARLVVWPETAVPGALGTDGAHTERLDALARETGAGLVVGAVGFEPGADGAAARFYDSAFLVDPERGLTGRYDKSHLVPFGEYMPLQDLLGRVFKAVARGVASTAVTPGAGPRALEVAAGPERLRAGLPICYELLFPDLVRRFVRDGGELLLAITNDAWYGRTGAPFQFLAITAMRSAENRVWTARAANTGVSAIIDARGRVRERTGIFERGLLVADVPRRPAPAGGSFYARHGDLFAWACWAVTLGALGWIRAGERKGAAT